MKKKTLPQARVQVECADRPSAAGGGVGDHNQHSQAVPAAVLELEASIVEGTSKLVVATCPYCQSICKWVTLKQPECRIFHQIREVCEHASSVSHMHKPSMIFRIETS